MAVDPLRLAAGKAGSSREPMRRREGSVQAGGATTPRLEPILGGAEAPGDQGRLFALQGR